MPTPDERRRLADRIERDARPDEFLNGKPCLVLAFAPDELRALLAYLRDGGAEGMRERAAAIADAREQAHKRNADGYAELGAGYKNDRLREKTSAWVATLIARQIRALPLDPEHGGLSDGA